nr:MAG TPA: hypothetical protein [Caudoviricetes sp.]
MIIIKVKVISDFYDSIAGNILRRTGEIIEVTEERFNALKGYVEKIETEQSKDA